MGREGSQRSVWEGERGAKASKQLRSEASEKEQMHKSAAGKYGFPFSVITNAVK